MNPLLLRLVLACLLPLLAAGPAASVEPETDSAAAAQAAAPAAPAAAQATAAVAVAADAWIRPEDIVDRADAIAQHIDARRPDAKTLAAIQKIETDLTAIAPNLLDALAQAKAALSAEASLLAIQDARHELESAATPFPAWKEYLAAEAKRASDVLDEIAQAQRRWAATRDRPETAQAGAVVVRRVDSSLVLLAESAAEFMAWRTRVLALSDQLLERSRAISEALKRLEAATLAEGSGLLVPDHLPLWQRSIAGRLAGELPQAPRRFIEFQNSTRAYFAQDARPFVLQAMIALVLMSLFRNLSQRAQQHLTLSQVSPETAHLLERPFAIALLLALILTPALHPSAPQRVMQLMTLLALLPVARILILANQRANLALYVGLSVVIVLDRAASAFAALPTVTLAISLVQLVFALGLAFEYRRRLVRDGGAPWLVRLVGMGLLALGLALLAEIGGWSRLATLVGRGAMVGATGALYVYAATISLEALCAYALASPTLRRSRFIDRNQALLQRWISVALRGIGALFWARAFLRALGLSSVASDAVASALGAGVSVGALSLSVGGVLAFVMTLAVAMLISRLVHEVLEDEIFPRTSLPRGIPTALLALTRYAIYSLGFLLALAAAGVELGQLAILLGGLGVGIGLGLQDLVKNFAAGLTLLFERRVHVGDAVQIPGKDVFGRVVAIGMRASVVRNWNGTEVVMPNDDLVAGTVTNWTLTDRIHRIEVKVGVPFGTDPEAVIALLLDVARADEHLLKSPPPSALFKGFGDSTLDFMLGGWTDQDYELTGARTSALGLAVHRALRDSGIDLASSQRDVNLLRASAAALEALREKAPAG